MKGALLAIIVIVTSFFAASYAAPCCGNGRCETPLESCRSCPSDCGICPACSTCGNGVCDASAGENTCNCPLDCGPCCIDGICREDRNETALNCPADCGVILRIKVVDAATNLPLNLVNVRCTSVVIALPLKQSGTDGRVKYAPIAGGQWVCTGELFGYLPGSLTVNLFPKTFPQEYIMPLKKNPSCIQGTVYDAVTLEPLDESTVFCANKDSQYKTDTRITGVMGGFYYEPVDPACYRCYAARAQYYPGSNDGCVTPGAMVTIDIYLQPLPGALLGTVYNTVDNSRIPGANISCTLFNNQPLNPVAFTGPNVPGYYYNDVPAGKITCTASKADFTSQTKNGRILRSQNTTIDFFLTPLPGVLIVTTIEAGSSPVILVGGANLVCTALDATAYKGVTDLVNANISFSGVVPSTYTCVGAAPALGYGTGTTSNITVPSNRVVRAIVPLPPLPGNIIVYVYDNRTGLALPNGPVTLTPSFSVITDATAQYLFTGLAYGNYTAGASYTGYNSNTGSASLPKGQTVTIRIPLVPLPAGLIVNIIATDTLALIPGAALSLTGTENYFSFSTLASGSGTFTLNSVGLFSGIGSASGYESNTNGTIVVRNATVTMNIYLIPLPNIVIVNVRDITNNQLILSVTPSVTLTQYGARDGNPVTYTNVAAGSGYVASATAEGYFPNSTNVVPNPQRNLTIIVNVYLSPRPCVLNVTVLANGTFVPLSAATVFLIGTNQSIITGAEGFVTFTLATYNPPSSVLATKASFIPAGSNPAGGAFQCSRGRTVQVIIYLQQVIQIRIQAIVAQSLDPIANAQILFNDVAVPLLNDEQFVHTWTVFSLPAFFKVSASAAGFLPSGPFDYVFRANTTFQNISLDSIAFTLFFLPYEIVGNGSNTWPVTPNSPEGYVDPNDPIFSAATTIKSSTSGANALRIRVGGTDCRLVNGVCSPSTTVGRIAGNDVTSGSIFWFAPQVGRNIYQNANDEAANPFPFRDFPAVYSGSNSVSSATYIGDILGSSYSSISPSSLSTFDIQWAPTAYAVNPDVRRVPNYTPATAVRVRVPEYAETSFRSILFYVPCRLSQIYLLIYVLPFNTPTQAAATFVGNTPAANAQLRVGTTTLASSVTGFSGGERLVHQFPLTVGSTISSLRITVPQPPYDGTLSCWVDDLDPSQLKNAAGGACEVPPTLLGNFPSSTYFNDHYLNNGAPVAPSGQVIRKANGNNYVSFSFGYVPFSGKKRRANDGLVDPEFIDLEWNL
jgi:hypothetical protein